MDYNTLRQNLLDYKEGSFEGGEGDTMTMDANLTAVQSGSINLEQEDQEEIDSPSPDAKRNSKKRRKNDGDLETRIQGMEQLQEHDLMFQEMTKRDIVYTELDVVSMVMAYDSKLTIAITHQKEQMFVI